MLELEFGEIAKEGINQTVEVWSTYRNTSTAADEYCSKSTTALFEVEDAVQEFDGGDRQTVRGLVSFQASEVTPAELRAETSVQLLNGETYPVKHIHLVIRETKYQIKSVGEISEGMIACQVVSSVEKYGTPREVDPL